MKPGDVGGHKGLRLGQVGVRGAVERPDVEGPGQTGRIGRGDGQAIGEAAVKVALPGRWHGELWVRAGVQRPGGPMLGLERDGRTARGPAGGAGGEGGARLGPFRKGLPRGAGPGHSRLRWFHGDDGYEESGLTVTRHVPGAAPSMPRTFHHLLPPPGRHCRHALGTRRRVR